MGLIVQKFGGSSVKDRDRIFNVARIVMNTRNAGNDVVVVVSAQGDTTDDLITKAAEITSDPSHREMDMLLAAGEEISISLLTMALQELGVSAISLTGWQAGFNTDRAYSKARIKRLDTERVESELARNRVVVVAGFQGLNRSDDITTLGRGGSDTSAVALAAALHADRCQIFTDVEGVYSWWSYRFKAREKNAGWRIDYFVVTDSLKDKIQKAEIRADVTGSDHCPVVLEIDL